MRDSSPLSELPVAGSAQASPAVGIRSLLYSSVVYGAADVLVLAVGGLFLLPLYTRVLTQAEFGTFVIVRTNAELCTYLLYFGLPSAAARVYFDYRKDASHVDYMSSILSFFGVNLLTFLVVCYFWGSGLWTLLSPTTPASPYLWYSVAIASMAFFATLGPLWLRLEGKVHAFVSLQVGSAAVLAVTAVLLLLVWRLGLPGAIAALLVSSAVSAAVLPSLLGGRFKPVIRLQHVRESLHYAAPTVFGYVAYFVLNRISTVILQRHVDIDQIAVFGLTQQLAMLVTVVATSFGKAMQPAVFGGEAEASAQLLRHSARLLIVVMFCVTCGVMLFGAELLRLIAPQNYGAGYEILLILVWANFAYSFNLISSTALIYNRRPKTSVAVSSFGAALSAMLSLWLIPRQQLHGAALATAVAFVAMMLCGQWTARKFTGGLLLWPMTGALTAAGVVGMFAVWIQRQSLAMQALLECKIGVAILVAAGVYAIGKLSGRGNLSWQF